METYVKIFGSYESNEVIYAGDNKELAWSTTSDNERNAIEFVGGVYYEISVWKNGECIKTHVSEFDQFKECFCDYRIID